jgi:hypothetical protein
MKSRHTYPSVVLKFNSSFFHSQTEAARKAFVDALPAAETDCNQKKKSILLDSSGSPDSDGARQGELLQLAKVCYERQADIVH